MGSVAVEDLSAGLANLRVEDLHPLTPEIIQRQATINIGMPFINGDDVVMMTYQFT
jgi:hypothetical protein